MRVVWPWFGETSLPITSSEKFVEEAAVTDPHTDGGQAPASPVHHVEEEETRHRDEVGLWTRRTTSRY